MDWFTLDLDAFSLTTQAALHLAFLCRLTGRRVRVRHFVLYLGLLVCAQWICVAAGWGTPPALVLMLSALYAVSRLALKNGPAQSCTAALLAVYIYQLSTGAMNSLEAAVCPYVPLGLPLYGLIVLAALASLGLCWACYAFVLRLLPTGDCGPYPGLLSLPGLFFLAAELYILETAYNSLPVSPVRPGRHLALLTLQALGLAALLCTLYAYRRACRGLEAQRALESLAQSVQAQRTYVAEAQARYEKTRSFRHDLQNHLSVLGGLLSAGRAEEARAYLQKLEAVSGTLAPPCRTGDAAVDALLGEKLALAEARGIPAEVSLRLPEEGDGFDLCVIFANALDNALRACEEAEGEPFLRIRGQRQGDFYHLEFENSCAPGPPPEPGTGLRNIRAAAEKYGGAAAWEKAGGRFRLDVLLNISGQRNGSSGQSP